MGVIRLKFLCSLLISLLTAGIAEGREVQLTLSEADSLFVARNLELLAARCNITLADADIEQARLWANPVITFQENAYNPVHHRVLDFGDGSQQEVDVDQLIYIAGQHSTGVKVARASREVALAQFDDLVRTLRCELHKTFVNLYFAQQNMGLYQSEILSLRQTLDALVTQVNKGNISRIEAARIQALLLSLSTEQDGYSAQVATLQGQLQVLLALGTDVTIKADFDPSCIASMPSADAIGTELTDSLDSRADVRAAKAGQLLASAQLRQEKSKAWPELHITGQWDRNGGPFDNYVGVGFSVSVPIFDRNQGGIHRAQAALAQSREQLDDVRQRAATDVAVARENFVRSLRLEQTVAGDHDKTHIDGLFQSVTDNYRRRNISLLEFVDFYNTYKEAMLQMASVKANVFITAEELNSAAGRQVIKY